MTDQARLTMLQTNLAKLRSLGVFYLIPTIEERPDEMGELLVFRKRGHVVCDPDVRFRRYISLPVRDSKRRAELLEKLERTKQAAKLVREINDLSKQVKAENSQELIKAQAHEQAMFWRRIAENLREEAERYESRASAVLAHA